MRLCQIDIYRDIAMRRARVRHAHQASGGLNFRCPLSVRCSVCAFQTRQSYKQKQHPTATTKYYHPASTKYHQ
eukprot:scaffold19486_cov171-Skeletonema_marinoi.AAC.3